MAAGSSYHPLKKSAWKEEPMAAWEPIRRTGAPEPQDIDERVDRILLSFPLSETPPHEWGDYFESLHRHADYPPLEVRGKAIRVWSRRSQANVEGWIGNVDRDIERANKDYESVLVNRRQQDEDALEAEERRRQKLEEARGWIEGLKPPKATP
jgi:hypothetical protein